MEITAKRTLRVFNEILWKGLQRPLRRRCHCTWHKSCCWHVSNPCAYLLYEMRTSGCSHMPSGSGPSHVDLLRVFLPGRCASQGQRRSTYRDVIDSKWFTIRHHTSEPGQTNTKTNAELLHASWRVRRVKDSRLERHSLPSVCVCVCRVPTHWAPSLMITNPIWAFQTQVRHFLSCPPTLFDGIVHGAFKLSTAAPGKASTSGSCFLALRNHWNASRSSLLGKRSGR